MSPASAGNLEVERYIGACLISRNRVKNKPVPQRQNAHYQHNVTPREPEYHPKHQLNFRLQRCHSMGMPLISFAQHQRHKEDNSLAKLAVHTQGAPLVLAKSYNHRKNKVNRPTKVYENTNKKPTNHVDTVSVASDESSGSANSETCLPRIIKPRKRRKKERKPPHLNHPLNHDGFSTDSASPDIETTQIPYLTHNPFNMFNLTQYNKLVIPETSDYLDGLSETPKLHHSFEDIEEPDVNGNQPTTICQCRYCDPSGQIWDVDRECYSPFLTPPPSKSFQFPNLSLLEHSMSSISLEDEEKVIKKTPTSRSSSSSSCRDLEVSTEIVTSLNGHRDLEIKFFSSPIVEKNSESRKFSEMCFVYEE